MRSKGFTLVELAIVMVIIGILIGGILKGHEMIKAARVKRVITEVKEYGVAYHTYVDKYNAVPGDHSTAMQMLTDCNADNFCQNGNGNGRIGAPAANFSRNNQAGTNTLPQSETTQFWKHLRLAGMIGGVEANANPTAPLWGETHPRSTLGRGGYHVMDVQEEAGANSARGHFIVLRLPENGDPHPNTPGLAPVSPIMAREIDSKMDDGNAMNGSVRADDAAGTCSNPGTGAYNTPTDETNCLMIFKISN